MARPKSNLRSGGLAVGVSLSVLAAGIAGAASRAPLPMQIRQARILVLKGQRELRVYSADSLLRTYPIALGLNPVPPKARSGDHATPEGPYYVCSKNPRSQFLLALGLSYPGPGDAERGLRARLISRRQYRGILEAARRLSAPPWNTALGGAIFIHGGGSSADWTWGCIALADSDITELYPRIPVGTPVVIQP